MPLVFDVASKTQGRSVFDMAREKRESDDIHKAREQALEEAIYRQDEYEAGRGTRDARNEFERLEAERGADNSRRQAEIDEIRGRINKDVAIGELSDGINDEQSYQRRLPELLKADPSIEWPKTYAEAKDELASYSGYFNQQWATQKQIEKYKELANGEGPSAKIASEVIRGLEAQQELALEEQRLKIRESEAKIASDEALARQRNAKADDISKGEGGTKAPPQPTKENITAAKERLASSESLASLDDKQATLASRRIADRARQIQDEQKVIYADALDMATEELESQLETYKEVQSIFGIDVLNPDDKKTVTAKSKEGKLIQDARDAIAAGADREAVIAELETKHGIRDADI